MTGRGSTRARRAAVVATLAASILAGCSGGTDPATSVGTTTATLNGVAACPAHLDGRWGWQWRQLGSSSWSSGGAVAFDCTASGRPPLRLTHTLTGLAPDTTYQFQLVVDLDEPCNLKVPRTCSDVGGVDSNGALGGKAYDTFTTQPQCDDTQGATESLAAFLTSNPPGTAADRRVLCLRSGTQDVGQVKQLGAWSTLTPRGEPDGTKQPAVLNGNLALENRGAAVEDVAIVGCYSQAGCDTQRNKTVDVRAPDVVLRHLDITQRGGRNRDVLQCVMIANGSQLTGVRLEFSKVHSCGNEASGNLHHGLYCSDALGAQIVGNWFYDNEGFGIQMYPNCDGARAVGNVVAENGGGCDVSGAQSSLMSSGSEYRAGFCGFQRESSDFPPLHCGPTSANHAVDMVLYGGSGYYAMSSGTDCSSSQLKPTGTLNTDPQFVNRAGYDFRMRSSAARAKLGVYAEIVPGPRW